MKQDTKSDSTPYTAYAESSVIQYDYPYEDYGISLRKYSSHENVTIGHDDYPNANPYSKKNMLAFYLFYY